MIKTKYHYEDNKITPKLTFAQKAKVDSKWDSSNLLSIPEFSDDNTNNKAKMQSPEFLMSNKYFKEYDKILQNKDLLSQLLSRKHQIFEQNSQKNKNFVPEYFSGTSIKRSPTTDSYGDITQSKVKIVVFKLKHSSEILLGKHYCYIFDFYRCICWFETISSQYLKKISFDRDSIYTSETTSAYLRIIYLTIIC